MARTFNTPTTTTVEPIVSIANILQYRMNLNNNQIILNYQKNQIPPDGLYLTLNYSGPDEAIASQATFDSSTQTEINEAVYSHNINIQIMSLSPDNSARIRKEEIPLALRSNYAKQIADKNLLGISWLPSDILDISYFDETAFLNRFSMNIVVYALHRLVVDSDSFDSFPVSIEEQNGITYPINTQVNPYIVGG